MKTVYVGFSFPHHGDHTGYDLISKFTCYDKYINCQKGFDILSRFNKKQNLLTKLYGKVFKGWLWWVELKLIFISMFNPNKYIFHLAYGENLFRFFGYFKFGNKVVLSLHQPALYFEKDGPYILRRNLKYADKIIVLSSELKRYIEKNYPQTPTQYIPHGIDCDYFKPKNSRENIILLVGNWLRDFVFANEVFEDLLKINSEVTICIVTNKNNHKYFKSHSSIRLLSNISDDELLNLYQKAKCLFLPLYSFTANNAILEAASAGCPIVVATNSIDYSYFSDEQITFLPLQQKLVVKSLNNQMLNEFDIIKSEKLIDFVKNNYSWEKISALTYDFIKYF